MKQAVFVACVLLFSSKQKSKDDPVRSITIIKTNLSIETPVPISCEEAANMMPRDTFYIYQKKKVRKLLKLIHEATTINRPCGMDARARIIMNHKSGQKDTLCIGYSHFFQFNGQCKELPRMDLIKILRAMDRDIRPDEIEKE